MSAPRPLCARPGSRSRDSLRGSRSQGGVRRFAAADRATEMPLQCALLWPGKAQQPGARHRRPGPSHAQVFHRSRSRAFAADRRARSIEAPTGHPQRPSAPAPTRKAPRRRSDHWHTRDRSVAACASTSTRAAHRRQWRERTRCRGRPPSPARPQKPAKRAAATDQRTNRAGVGTTANDHAILLEPRQAADESRQAVEGNDTRNRFASFRDRHALPLLHPTKDLSELGLRLVHRIGPRHDRHYGSRRHTWSSMSRA